MFDNIEEKKAYRFLQFDIKEFYFYVSEYLLNKAINLAQKFIILGEEEKKILNLLFVIPIVP